MFFRPSQSNTAYEYRMSIAWSELRDVYIEKCFEEISVEDVLRRYALQTTDDHHGWGFQCLAEQSGVKERIVILKMITKEYY